jgi:hypothetical protein
MTTTMSSAPLSGFSAVTGSLIVAFVTGFRSAKTRSNYRANLCGWFRWTPPRASNP